MLYMRATFLYRIFVCFILEVLLYFFFILGHCIFYCCPMLFVVCCLLYSSLFVYTVQRPAVQCSSSFFTKIWWSEDLSGDRIIYLL